jgi:hypothetical protein
MKKIVFLLLGLCIVFISYLNYGFFWIYDEKRALMKDYLEGKYKDSFLLEDIHFEWTNGGSYYTYATAMSTNSKFHVDISKDNKIEDSYVLEYWNYEGIGLIKPYFSKNFDRIHTVSINLFFQSNIPSDKELNSHLDKIEWEVVLELPYELDEDNQSIELEKIMKSIDGLQKSDFKIRNLQFIYMSKYLSLNKHDLDMINHLNQLSEHIKIR